jgi:hypothetical protein
VALDRNFPAAAGCTDNAFPCDEAHLWNGTTAELSFPSLRAAGTTSGPPYSPDDYRAWSVLWLISDGTNLTKAKLLVSGAQYAAVGKRSCWRTDWRFAGGGWPHGKKSAGVWLEPLRKQPEFAETLDLAEGRYLKFTSQFFQYKC